MKASNFIASRLRFKGRLATIAVTVSFFVMILSLAIAGGFRRELRSGISEISGDIMIGESEPAVSLDQQQLIQLREVRGVETVTPVIWKPGIVKGESDICGVLVKGVPMPDSCSMQASIPELLARRMRLAPGDAMVTYFVDDKVKARRFKVADVYQGILDSDQSMVVKVPLTDMQRLCGMERDEAGALEVRVTPEFAEGAKLAVKADELSWITRMRTSTSVQRYPQIFDWLNLIDFNVLAILLLMTVVAGFNMISGLLILLFRNTSTIGMLKSMGMGDKGIARVFLLVSARIVLTGMVIGNALALLFCLIQGNTHLLKLNPANYFVSYVPVHVNLPLVLITDAAAFLLIMLLLLIPTLFISKVDPAKTVRVR